MVIACRIFVVRGKRAGQRLSCLQCVVRAGKLTSDPSFVLASRACGGRADASLLDCGSCPASVIVILTRGKVVEHALGPAPFDFGRLAPRRSRLGKSRRSSTGGYCAPALRVGRPPHRPGCSGEAGLGNPESTGCSQCRLGMRFPVDYVAEGLVDAHTILKTDTALWCAEKR